MAPGGAATVQDRVGGAGGSPPPLPVLPKKEKGGQEEGGGAEALLWLQLVPRLLPWTGMRRVCGT